MTRMLATISAALGCLAGAPAHPAQAQAGGERPAEAAGPPAERATTPADRATTEEKPPAGDEATRPRPQIRVLQDPYDLASFYRSGGSSPDGWAGLRSDPAYSIAGFYRAQDRNSEPTRYGWSRFWAGGYGASRPIARVPYRRTIGENGDLFLAVPFLAPVGAISGSFSGY